MLPAQIFELENDPEPEEGPPDNQQIHVLARSPLDTDHTLNLSRQGVLDVPLPVVNKGSEPHSIEAYSTIFRGGWY